MSLERAEKNVKKELDYQPFDPQLELKKILAFDSEENALRSDQKRLIRKQKIEEFVLQLNHQKRGLSRIISNLEDYLAKNPDADPQKMEELIFQQAPEARLADFQISQLRRGIEEYKKRRLAIQNFKNKYPNQRERFHSLFGFWPRGKIEIAEGPITLHFRCFDFEDYARIFHRAGDKEIGKIGKKEIEKANLSRGMYIPEKVFEAVPGINECIVIENAGLLAQKTDKKSAFENTKKHEEQHAIFNLFQKVLKNDFEDSEEIFEKMLKDEILAGLKGKKTLSAIKKDLLENKLYADIHESFQKSLKRKKEAVLAKKPAGGEYEKFVDSLIHCVELIQQFSGLKTEQIAHLLTIEPLRQWNKVAERFLKEARVKPDLIQTEEEFDEEILQRRFGE